MNSDASRRARVPSDPELEATVRRMETRFRASADAETVRLMALYDSLVERFDSDLAGERDRLLSRGGALMLVQSIRAQRGRAP
jgi:hypothetical protein